MGRKFLAGFLLGIVSTFGINLCLSAQPVSAWSVSACLKGAENEPMEEACRTGMVGSPGAAWINGSKKYSTADYVSKKKSEAKGKITAYMHGALYSYSGDAYARNIKLCTANWSGTHKSGSTTNQCNGHKTPSWIKSYDKSFYRGVGNGGWTYCPKNKNCGGKVIIDVDEFVSKATSKSTSNGYTTYVNYVWFARCANKSGTCGNNGWTYAADKIKVKIKIKDEETEEIDATPDAELTGMAYIGETAPTPTFSVSETVTIGSTQYDNVESANSQLTDQEVVSSGLQEIKFYVNADHDGSGLGEKNGYTGDDVINWACSQFGAAECNTTEKIPNETKYAGYKFCAAGATRIGIKYKIYEYDEDGNITNWYWSSPVWQPWKVSAASCIPIAKKTNVGIAGNDTYVNSGVKTAVSRKWSGMAYGSWSEFLIATGTEGIFGNTTDIGTSSGSGLYNGLSSSVQQSDTTKWSPESTGNQDISGQDVPAAGISTSSSNSFLKQVEKIVENGSTDAVEIRKVDSISTNITNSDVKKQIIVYSDGDINIADSVTQIDAWVIAPNGTVDTCAGYRTTADGAARNSGEEITTDKCNKQLQINGLVYASAIKLDRTYGGETNELSEIINLTPASFIWAYSQATSTYANPTTVYTRELAPRM